VRAVDGVTLAIPSGPFGLALVGESGSGKTTIGRAVLHLVPAAGGQVRFEAPDKAARPEPVAYRRAAQIVFQTRTIARPAAAGQAIGEVLAAHRSCPRPGRQRAGELPAAYRPRAGRPDRTTVRRAAAAVAMPARCRCSHGCWC
jgi:ABC-type glutathione transport system ATPase component